MPELAFVKTFLSPLLVTCWKKCSPFNVISCFKVRNKLAPSYMDEVFVSQDTVHSYNTRFSDKGGYGLPKVKGSSSKSFCILASKLWKSLLSFLTTIKYLNNFKVSIKDFLMKNLYKYFNALAWHIDYLV